MSRIRLYLDAFWISPYSYSVFVALKEKGLDFDLIELALDKGEHKQGEYARHAPTGKIPGIQHGDFWLAESGAILEYLEETFPAPKHPRLLPREPEARAKARMVLSWVRCDMLALREERPTTTMFYERAKTPLSPTAEAAAARLLSFTDALLPSGATHLFGDWTIADADLAFMLQRLMMNGHKVPAKIGDFVEAQWARPSIRAFVDHPRLPYKSDH